MQFGVSNVIKEIVSDIKKNETILQYLSTRKNPTNPADLMPTINDYGHPCLIIKKYAKMPDDGPMSVNQYVDKILSDTRSPNIPLNAIYSDYHSNHDCLWIILKKHPLSSRIINVGQIESPDSLSTVGRFMMIYRI